MPQGGEAVPVFCSKERLLVIFGIFFFVLNYKLW